MHIQIQTCTTGGGRYRRRNPAMNLFFKLAYIIMMLWSFFVVQNLEYRCKTCRNERSVMMVYAYCLASVRLALPYHCSLGLVYSYECACCGCGRWSERKWRKRVAIYLRFLVLFDSLSAEIRKHFVNSSTLNRIGITFRVFAKQKFMFFFFNSLRLCREVLDGERGK